MPEVITQIDHSPAEVESLEELTHHLQRGTLAHLAVQGLDLEATDLSTVEVHHTLFVGCALTPAQIADLARRGAQMVPIFSDKPYPTQPSRLYSPEELSAGFADGGFASMYDTVVYQHFLDHGGAAPDLREALAQRVHDHGIDNALAHVTDEWIEAQGKGSIVGVMGGHAELRGSAGYRAAAALAWRLANSGKLILTGGGPGVMEAANLGSYLSTFPESELVKAIDELTAAPDFHDHEPYTAVALAVRDRYQSDAPWEKRGGLSVPTWFYGHEPANLFAAKAAKMFSNASREEVILKLSRGGIVFAPGRAGTVQEVFQAATMTFYGSAGGSGPFVFLGRRYWTEDLPVDAVLGPLLTTSPMGDQSPLIHLTDDVVEAATLLTD